ncbi:PXA domain-containing protein [Lipomyces japonicus]|uniref:PXA domain-containing protein n=1 Tax=Lipomyces japonicus TaxID=56871 RepID=UPI0034CF1CDC
MTSRQAEVADRRKQREQQQENNDDKDDTAKTTTTKTTTTTASNAAAYYHNLALRLLADASTTQIVVTSAVVIPALAFLFGVPLFFLAVGVVIGVFVAFPVTPAAAAAAGADADVMHLPWKRNSRYQCENFNQEFKPFINSSYSVSPEVDQQITRATTIILDQYIESWYQNVSPDDSTFLDASRKTIHEIMTSIAGQQASKRPADLFLVLLFSTCNTFVVFLRELRVISSTYSANSSTTSAAIHDYIVLNPSSALAQMVDRDIQASKLRNAASNLIQTFLPVLDMRRSPVALLVREIIANQVIKAAVDAFSDPDTVNRWIINFLQKEENIKALAESETEKSKQFQPVSDVDDLPTDAATTTPKITTTTANALSPPPVSSNNGFVSPQQTSSVKKIERKPLHSEPLDDHKSFVPTSFDEILNTSDRPLPFIPTSLNSTTTITSTSTSTETETATATATAVTSTSTSTALNTPISSSRKLLSPQPSSSFSSSTVSKQTERLSLFQANIIVIDSSADQQSSKALHSKPLGFYTLVIEPTGSSTPGWMAMRNLADFEKLHVVLQKLSVLAGLTTFPEIFPPYQGVTRSDYCQTLQSYMQLVVNTRELADCEAMKKFVDKKETTTANEKRFIKVPFKSAGEGVLEAISKATTATHSAKDSRKAIMNVLAAAKRQSVDTISRTKESISLSSRQQARPLSVLSPVGSHSEPAMNSLGYSQEHNYSSTSIVSDIDGHVLPPLPSEISDNYRPELTRTKSSTSSIARSSSLRSHHAVGSTATNNTVPSIVSESANLDDDEFGDVLSSGSSPRDSFVAPEQPVFNPTSTSAPSSNSGGASEWRHSSILSGTHEPLTQAETNSLIDTLFLAISELYLLSNVWNVRRSLLTVLRGVVLRHGSSSVEGIRVAIQKDVIDKYSSEHEISRKLGDLINALWPELAASGDDDADQKPAEIVDSSALKAEARRMFVGRVMPDGIKSVMGTAASTQALEFVFDALQDRNIARGLVLNLLMDCITTLLM